ncbi:uncharacterized protein LOC129835933 [Salvelinus fontinalis]|uniref:uncharacterized protein LOC129835933 n=1 Tax=Salvelinus fontinalis TaxID=8038 RepID=UPI002485DCE0|nr:uncharacterized protein LOC129835933 [Salvelinus fontinalis]
MKSAGRDTSFMELEERVMDQAEEIDSLSAAMDLPSDREKSYALISCLTGKALEWASAVRREEYAVLNHLRSSSAISGRSSGSHSAAGSSGSHASAGSPGSHAPTGSLGLHPPTGLPSAHVPAGLPRYTECVHNSSNSGTPELYVDQQEMTGVVGGSVTVLCYYSSYGGSRRWCRMGGSCVAVGSSEAFDGTVVKLVQEQRETTNGFVLTVTMSGLMMENTGWYWCEKGDLQITVHITVNQPTTTQSTTTTTQAPTSHQTSLTSAESNTSPPTVTPSVTDRDNVVTNENTDEKHQSLLEVLFIPLSLLVVLIAVTLVTLKMLRKHKDKKAKDQPTNTSVQPADPEQDITYSTVRYIRGTAQQDLNSDMVTYTAM